jgi:hypothetical protein
MKILLVEYWGDNCQIRQMGSTSARVIGKYDVSTVQIVAKMSQLELDCLLHCSQMDRDVRRIRHQASVRPKKSARKIKALFNVGRNSCPLQYSVRRKFRDYLNLF